jgi:hypothetical protein
MLLGGLLLLVSFRACPTFIVAPARSVQGGRADASRVTTHIQNENAASLSEIAHVVPAFEEQAIVAIEACIAEGMSVESVARLGAQLRSLELQVAKSIEKQSQKLHATGATAAEDKDELAYLVGVRQRIENLSGQMEALQGVVAYLVYNPQDESLGREFVQAVTEALGLNKVRRNEA